MSNKAQLGKAVVGVAEHGNSAVLVTVSEAKEVLDRRTVDLTGPDLPTHPYHHEGSWAVGRYRDSAWAREITLPEAIELVAKVETAAAEGAVAVLSALAGDLPVAVGGIAIRVCPELPETIEERIRDNRAQSMADSVMYRQALAVAAQNLGWSVVWYDRDQVFEEAGAVLGEEDVEAALKSLGRPLGPPWQARHKLAAAAALVAAKSMTSG
jgi:hypothetical protein